MKVIIIAFILLLIKSFGSNLYISFEAFMIELVPFEAKIKAEIKKTPMLKFSPSLDIIVISNLPAPDGIDISIASFKAAVEAVKDEAIAPNKAINIIKETKRKKFFYVQVL